MSRHSLWLIMIGVMAFKLFSLDHKNLKAATIPPETVQRVYYFQAQYTALQKQKDSDYGRFHQLRKQVSESLIYAENSDELHLLLGQLLLDEARLLKPRYPQKVDQQQNVTPLLNAAYSEFSLLLDQNSPFQAQAAYFRYQVCPECEDSDLVLSCKLGYTLACKELIKNG